MTVHEFLELAKSKGVTLYLENGKLLLNHTNFSFESLRVVEHVDDELEKALVAHFLGKHEDL